MTLALQSGCGGNSGQISPSGGTPAGTYTVTVNAASASVAHSAAVTVSVH
jgi:hypothetical protein